MATYQAAPSTGLTVVSDHDPVTLCARLRKLPAGTEVVAIYGQGGSNIAWVKVPEPTPEPPQKKAAAEEQPAKKADESKRKPTKEA